MFFPLILLSCLINGNLVPLFICLQLQVLFMADGKNASNTYHLAVDKIDIASKPCNRIPLYSDPGRYKSKQLRSYMLYIHIYIG